jgi:hypothetical protein
MLKSGYTYIRSENIPEDWDSFFLPVHLVSELFAVPDFNLEVGINPTFLLEKNGEVHYAVINGFLIDLSEKQSASFFKNSMIYR